MLETSEILCFGDIYSRGGEFEARYLVCRDTNLYIYIRLENDNSVGVGSVRLLCDIAVRGMPFLIKVRLRLELSNRIRHHLAR